MDVGHSHYPEPMDQARASTVLLKPRSAADYFQCGPKYRTQDVRVAIDEIDSLHGRHPRLCATHGGGKRVECRFRGWRRD